MMDETSALAIAELVLSGFHTPAYTAPGRSPVVFSLRAVLLLYSTRRRTRETKLIRVERASRLPTRPHRRSQITGLSYHGRA